MVTAEVKGIRSRKNVLCEFVELQCAGCSASTAQQNHRLDSMDPADMVRGGGGEPSKMFRSEIFRNLSYLGRQRRQGDREGHDVPLLPQRVREMSGMKLWMDEATRSEIHIFRFFRLAKKKGKGQNDEGGNNLQKTPLVERPNPAIGLNRIDRKVTGVDTLKRGGATDVA